MKKRAVYFLLSILLIITGEMLSASLSKQEGQRLITKKSQPHYQLAICSIFQNEACYLKEWIEFHRLVGVEHFYLFNNLSIDDFHTVLAPYVKDNIVTVIEWPYPDFRQCAAYDKAIKMFKNQAKWMAFLDTDEFLFCVEKDNLVDFLKDYEDVGVLLVNWQVFGTNDVEKVPRNKLMIEMLTMKAPWDSAGNLHAKSIVRPCIVKEWNNAHSPAVYPTPTVNADKVYVPYGYTDYIVIDKIRINHYWLRDEWFFWNIKLKRRQQFGDDPNGLISTYKSLNAVEDLEIQRFVPELRKRMGF